jgi:hypothetical protein
MNSIAVRRYKSTDVKDSKGGHQKPSVITQGISNHKHGHFVRPNMVALKYLDFKKNADPDAHVKVFNLVMKVNANTSIKYIINAFSSMLKYIAPN